jgi:hypothetical protein
MRDILWVKVKADEKADFIKTNDIDTEILMMSYLHHKSEFRKKI